MTTVVPLVNLRAGQSATIVGCRAGRGLMSRLAAMGFTPGSRITMLNNYNYGPLLVMVHDCRVALGRGEASKILVRLT